MDIGSEQILTLNTANAALVKEWLFHLKCAGFSLAKIAYRTQLSPSAVEKLIRVPLREPRVNTTRQLAIFFMKVFGEPPRKSVVNYLHEHQIEIFLLLKLANNYL
jgi:hypothetical protein